MARGEQFAAPEARKQRTVFSSRHCDETVFIRLHTAMRTGGWFERLL